MIPHSDGDAEGGDPEAVPITLVHHGRGRKYAARDKPARTFDRLSLLTKILFVE